MKTLATPPERSLIRRPSSGRVTTENASRCYSHTSSAFCGWVACGCAVLVARKMSSLSARSHRTYDGSPNWSSDHHQWVACVLRSVRHMVLKPLLERLQRDRVSCRSSDSRFLQQNLHKADVPRPSLQSAVEVRADLTVELAANILRIANGAGKPMELMRQARGMSRGIA